MNDFGNRGARNVTDRIIGEWAPHPYQSLNEAGHILTVNQAWCDELGYTEAEVEGEWFGDFLRADSVANFEDQFPEFISRGAIEDVEFEMKGADGSTIPVSFDGQVEYDDTGGFVRTHCQFTNLRPVQEKQATINRLSEYRRVLSAVDQTLVRIDDQQEMLQSVTEIISNSDPFGCTFIALTDDKESDFVCESGSRLDSNAVREFHTSEYLSRVLAESSVFIEDVTTDPYNQHVGDVPPHAGLGVPIQHGERDYGVLTIHFPPGKNPTEEEQGLLEQLGTDIGVFLRNQDLEQDRQLKTERLATRERLFRKLHELTQVGLNADSKSELFDRILEGMVDTLDHPEMAILEIDSEDGELKLSGASEAFEAAITEPIRLTPADEPIWQVFTDKETRIIPSADLKGQMQDQVHPAQNIIAVPIGDYGVFLMKTESENVLPMWIEMMELCADHCEAILGRIRREGEVRSLSAERDTTAQKADKFWSLAKSIQQIHEHIAGTETNEEMYNATCEQLVQTDVVDFAWIGRPVSKATDLELVASAGSGSGYLDAIDLRDERPLVPAQQAATSREIVRVDKVAEHIHESPWAKAALTADFASLLGLPIVDEKGVLYGVLVIYSSGPEAFVDQDEMALYGLDLLLATRLQMNTLKANDAQRERVELELEIRDMAYPLLAIARKKQTTLSYEGFIGASEDAVRVLVSVSEPAEPDFPSQVTDISKIRDARWFGNRDESLLLLEVKPPCIVTEVNHYGAKLVSSVVDSESATVTLDFPSSSTGRPLFERLQILYADIEMVARRETAGDLVTPNQTAVDNLTDRQRNVLEAAINGGYFDTPKGITGEDLAEIFDISNAAVSKHLRAAQRTIFNNLPTDGFDNRN